MVYFKYWCEALANNNEYEKMGTEFVNPIYGREENIKSYNY